MNNTIQQDKLREDLTYQAKRYLAYAEDIHFDHVCVNEGTFEVSFVSRRDNTRLPNCKYYSICDLIERDGLWFKPNRAGIEVIVQTYVPSEEVKGIIDKSVFCIRDFLIKVQPSVLRSCKFVIGICTNEMGCFDESTIEPIADDDEELEDSDVFKDYTLSDFVSKTATGYTISTDKLTKIALEHLQII